MSGVSCYQSNEGVLTQIYDPNGNALTMGEIVNHVNTRDAENAALRREVNALRAQLGMGRKYVEWNETKPTGGCSESRG